MANAEQERFQIQKDLDAEYQKHWGVTYWLAGTWPLLFRFFARLFSSEVSSEKNSEQFRRELLLWEDCRKKLIILINENIQLAAVLDTLWWVTADRIQFLVSYVRDDQSFQGLKCNASSIFLDFESLKEIKPELLRDREVVFFIFGGRGASHYPAVYDFLKSDKDFKNKEIFMLLSKAGSSSGIGLENISSILRFLHQVSPDLIKDLNIQTLGFCGYRDDFKEMREVFDRVKDLPDLKNEKNCRKILETLDSEPIWAFLASLDFLGKNAPFSQQEFDNCFIYPQLLSSAVQLIRYADGDRKLFYAEIIKICERAHSQGQDQFTEEQRQEIRNIGKQKQSPASTSSTTSSVSPLISVLTSLATFAPTASSSFSSASVVNAENAEGAGVVPSEGTRPYFSI